MATELATAYVSIIPSTRGLGRKLMRELHAEVPKASASGGAAAGAGFLGGATKALKVGALGGAVVGAFTVKKGLDRALSLENAEAKLKGLGHSSKTVEKIMGSANAAVLDTSYTLDQAGTVAASAVAAGVKPGKELTKYLKLTADAATIGGTSLEEMGGIINKTTARGKVYTENLNQLAERGIPIFQWLADEYGVTQEGLAEMVRRGEVDSATFQRAIEKNIGGAALESGETTTGAFNNMLAAIGRVGANIMGELLPLIAGGFRGITGVFKSIEPLAKALGGAIADIIGGFVTWVRESEGVQRTIGALKGILKGVYEEFKSWAGVLADNRGNFSLMSGIFEGMWRFLADILEVIEGQVEWIPRLIAAYTAWRGAQKLLNAVMKVNPIIAAIGVIAIIAGALYHAYENNEKFRTSVKTAWEKISGWFETAWERIKPILDDLGELGKKAWDKIKDAAGKAWEKIRPVLSDLWKAIREDLVPAFQEMGRELGKAWETAGPALQDFWDKVLKPVLGAMFGLLIYVIIPLATNLGVAWIKGLTGVVKAVSWAMEAVAGIIGWFRETVWPKIAPLWDQVKDKWGRSISTIGGVLRVYYERFIQPVIRIVRQRFQNLGKAIDVAWRAIGWVLRAVWNNVIQPVFKAVRGAIGRVRDAFQRARDFIGRVWGALGSGLSAVYQNYIKPAFDKVRAGLTRVRNAFTAARGFIGRVWGGIVNAIKNPIKAAMGIINRFLIRPINSIAGALNIKGGKLIGEISTKGWAKGGYTGRMSRRAVAGVVHGDEHVIRARSRRALERDRPGALDWMNQTGMWPGYARGGRVMPLKGATFSTYPGHTGVDLNAPNDMGKPVLAAAAGVVSAVKHLKKSYGSHVWVRMADGLSAIYAHLSKITVKRGQRVAAGQQIGNVGSTGNSTGPHLHFEIRPQGTYAASKAFLQGAKHLAGGVAGTGEDGSGFISKILNARKTLKKKLKGVGGPIGDIVRGAAGKVANGAVDWVKSRVDKVFGWVKKGWNAVFGDNGDKPATSRSVQAAKGAAFNALKGMGWGHGQWSPLERLWMKESGWRWNARNPSSGAYGIPQALPASKMASAGKDWRTNPLTQIKWGLRYIKQRYGSPGKAWAHSQRTGWYDEGGWLEPYGMGGRRRGKNVAVNRSRKPEPILTAAQWALLKRYLPLKRAREKVTSMRDVERIVARVARKYGDTSRKAKRARQVALDARFTVPNAQWKKFQKMLPGYTKRAGRPETQRDMQRLLARVRSRYGRRSGEYRETRREAYRARFGGRYTDATWKQIKKLLPQTGQYKTASRAANQVRGLVLKTFGAQSPIYRRTAKLAAKINTATQKIASFNTSIENTKKAQTELAQNLTEKFRPDAFGNGLESLRLTLAANVNDARAFGAALKTATSKGLSGGLLKALAASGDVQTAKEIANLSRAQIQALENQWAQREKVTAQIGAQAASLAYGPDIRALRASISQQNRVLRSLRADLRDATYRGTKAGISGTTRKAKAKKKTKGRK